MIALFQSIFNFIKYPRLKRLSNISVNKKTTIVSQSVFLCLVIGIGLGLLLAVLEALGVYNSDSHAINKMFEENSPLKIILLAVVVAPFFEELIFRGPLTLFSKKYFRIAFYIIAVLFGYMHIYNFPITPQVLLFSPILVLPQIVLGLVFGYIRVRFGLIYSMLLHASYNGVLIIP